MVSVMLYPCMFCVILSMNLTAMCVACLTVFGLAICLGVTIIFPLNVMELFIVDGGSLLDV